MFVFDKNKKKNLLVFFLVLFVVGSEIFFVDIQVVSAVDPPIDISSGVTLGNFAGALVDDIWNNGENAIIIGFKMLLYSIFVLFGWLASLALIIFEWAIRPQYFTLLLDNDGVYQSWQIVRDFFNLFFILALLYIAFTVVFQIQKNFKQALLSLVLAALLVNFSYPISRALIDATNVPMYFFVNRMMANTDTQTGGIFGQVLTVSKLKGILIPQSQNPKIEFATLHLPHLLMSIVFIFIFAVTLLVLSIMFVIRLVALVILVIFSSVGFAASIIPGLEKYSKMWWEHFWKYALFGPAAMLMLLIATKFFVVLENINTELVQSIQDVASARLTQETAGQNSDFFISMLLFSIPMIMLWAAMGLAQTMSIAGASSVVGMGQKVAKWAGRQATVTPLAWLGRKYEKAAVSGFGSKRMSGVTKWLAPTAVYKGWEKWREHGHEKDRSPVEHAGAEIADVFGRLPTQHHTDLAFKNFSANVSKEQKEIAAISTNSDYVIHELINAIKAQDDEKVVGALHILAQQNDLNDMMHVMDRIQKETGINFGTKTEDNPDGIASNEMSSENAKAVLNNMMLHAGLSKEMAAKNMLNLSNTAIAAGNVGMAGAARLGDDGKFRISTEEEQAEIAAIKLQNLETQARQRSLHHNAIFKERDKFEYTQDATGKKIKKTVEIGDEKHAIAHYGGINDLAGEEVLGTITTADIREAHRTRDDLKREIAMRMEVIRDGSGGMDLEGNVVSPEEVEQLKQEMNKVMQQNPNLNAYFKLLYAYQTGTHYDTQKPADKDGNPPKEDKDKKQQIEIPDKNQKTAYQPGDTVSSGGIVIPPGAKTA